MTDEIKPPKKLSRKVVIDIPAYKGEDRRNSVLKVGPCDCHLKHSQQIKDSEDDIEKMEDKIEVIGERTRQDHKSMWEEMRVIDRRKVSNKLFYIFITVYSAFFIGGMVTLYTGMHSIDKNLTEKIATITTEVKVELKGQEFATERIERDIDRLAKKVDTLSTEVRNGNNHRRE